MSEDSSENKDNGVDKLDGLISKMKLRLLKLNTRRQELLGELVPMDAAIHEIQQMLVAAGEPVEGGEWLEESKGARMAWVSSKSLEDIPEDIASFAPVPRGLQRQVDRRPIVGKRVGPDGSPPVVDKDAKEYVESPKSGTKVPTNAASVKMALRAKGQIR